MNDSNLYSKSDVKNPRAFQEPQTTNEYDACSKLFKLNLARAKPISEYLHYRKSVSVIDEPVYSITLEQLCSNLSNPSKTLYLACQLLDEIAPSKLDSKPCDNSKLGDDYTSLLKKYDMRLSHICYVLK